MTDEFALKTAVAEQFVYHPLTGAITMKKQLTCRKPIGSLAGYETETGYIRISVQKRQYYAHQIAWLMVYGTLPTSALDHINGDRKDNRIENLRIVSAQENMQNQRRAQKSNKSSGLLGAHWNKHHQIWCAKIQVNRKTITVGQFGTAEAAHAAYIEAKRKLHSGCTI